jgi:hypothetical protein
MIRKHTLTGTLATALAIGAAVAVPAGAQPQDFRSPDAKAAAQPVTRQDLRSPDAKDVSQPVAVRDLRSPDTKDVPQLVSTQDLRSADAKENWSPTSAAGLRAEAQERYYSSHGQPAPVPPVAEVASDGFEWGTAGIGLATGAGLALLSLGGLTITRRRAQEA